MTFNSETLFSFISGALNTSDDFRTIFSSFSHGDESFVRPVAFLEDFEEHFGFSFDEAFRSMKIDPTFDAFRSHFASSFGFGFEQLHVFTSSRAA